MMDRIELDAVDTFVDWLCKRIEQDGLFAVRPDWIVSAWGEFEGQEDESYQDIEEEEED